MKKMPREVRVLLVGDRNTGKTSLVCALCEENVAGTELEPVHEVVRVPAAATLSGAATVVVDSSLRTQTERQIEEEIRKADVLCVVYAVDDPPSFLHLSSFWLPLIRRARASDGERNAAPIVVVGNKLDLQARLQSGQDVTSLMHAFREIDTCIECSAVSLQNVTELFYFAQRAVLHPHSALYDVRSHTLKPAAVAALTRIFKLLDRDGDGLLSDDELQAFQVLCFDAPLSAAELAQIKEVVSHSTDDGLRGGGLTRPGFFFLHRSLIQRGLLEAAWRALRRFGYDNSLRLARTFSHPLLPPGPTELSAAAEEFLRQLFDRYDREHTGVLAPDQLHELWSICPGNPWEDSLLPGPDGRPPSWTWEHFLMLWRVLAFEDAQQAMELLAHLGFGIAPDTPTTSVAPAITVLRSPAEDRAAGASSRSVFAACVLGGPLVGKTTFLRRCGALGLLMRAGPSLLLKAVVPVPRAAATPLLLLLEEPSAEQAWTRSRPVTSDCDACIVLYDRSDAASFATAADMCSGVLQGRMGPPCVLVVSKGDLLALPQDATQTPEQFCLSCGMPPPLAAAQPHEVMRAVAAACMHPKPLPARKSEGGSAHLMLFGLAVLLAGLGAYVYRRLSRPKA